MKHKVELSRYEKVWNTINIGNKNFYAIVYDALKNNYSLHKDSINGYVKIASSYDPFLLLKHCK